MKKCVNFLVCVEIITIVGLCGRGGFVPRLKSAQNANAAQLAFSISNTLKLHMKNL